MANIDAPRGFLPVNRDGSPWSGTARLYDVDSAYASDIGVGSFVIQAADGNIELATAGATNKILGLDLQKTYSPASTSGKVLVAIADDNTYFVGQEDADTSYLGTADRGMRVNFIGTSVSTTTGRSSSELDSSSKGANATYQLQLVDKVDAPDNAYSTGVAGTATSNTDWIVKVNLPQHAASTAGV